MCNLNLIFVSFFYFQLDAKNSPLALLAQTCSAIGTDAPNPKLVANAEKNSKSSKLSINDSRDKVSPSSNSTLSNGSSSDIIQQKSSFKPYESSVLIQQPHHHHLHQQHHQPLQLQQHQSRTTASPAEDRPSSAYRIKTPKKSLTPLSQQQQQQTNGRCESNQSSASQRASPDAKTPLSSSGNRDNNNASPKRASSKESPSSAPINMSLESPLYNSFKLSDQSSNRSDISNYVKTSSAAAVTSVPITSASPYFSGYTVAPSGLPYSMDLMTASALMSSPHQSMFKAASMNPYFNYSRLKVPGDPMSGVCRDPYCTGCALSPHMMNKASAAPCPAGCTQCDHTNSAKSYASQLSAAQGSVAAAYAHAQLVAFAAASQMPYLCNWISGDAAYCGKRFGTSDELLQHLRTHTSAMPESMLNPAMAGLPPTHPLFQRTYPTPPLSPLSTARYHPYGKPSLLPPSLMPPTSLAGISMHNPSLAQYMSPYSLYGPRIGQSHP